MARKDPSERSPFAQNLRKLRKASKMTQEDVAAHLKVDRSTYAYYESDVSTPSLENLRILAHLFDCSTDFLLGLAPQDVPLNLRDAPLPNTLPAEVMLSREEQEMLVWYRYMDEEKQQDLLKTLMADYWTKKLS